MQKINTLPYYTTFTKFSALAKNNISCQIKNRRFFDERMVLKWVDIVGEEISSMFFPIYLRYVKDGIILVVNSKDLSFSGELKYHKKTIIERISVYFGRNSIVDIKLR